MKTAKPGDLLLKVYTAGWYNRVNRILGLTSTSFEPINQPETPIRIPVLTESQTFDQFDPASIDGPYIEDTGANPETSEMFATLACKITDTLDEFWGVVQTPITPDQEGQLVISGLTWAKINYTSTGHDHVTQQSGALVSASAGRGRIVHPPESVGVGYALIMIQGGGGGAVKHAVSPAGGIPGKVGNSMGSANCVLYDCNNSGVLSIKSPSESLIIYNPSRTAVEINTAIVYGINDAGIPVVLVEDCGE